MAARRIAIVGSGNWGSAIARIVGANTQAKPALFAAEVKMYVYEELIDGRKLTEIINTEHENVKYLPGKKLPVNVIAVPDIVETVKDADVLIWVVPHQFVVRLCAAMKSSIKPTAHAISLIKGVDTSDGLKLVSDIINDHLNIPVSVLMGANIAHEVAAEQFCETTIGCLDEEMRPIYKELFHASYFRVNVVDEVHAVELCGALKNVVALGAGFCDGLGFGDNTKAAIIRIGLQEMIKFVDMNFVLKRRDVFFESCGVADLITTCYGGRNRKCAESFVKTGRSWEEIEKDLLNGQKLQGTDACEEVNIILKARNQLEEFPLFTTIHKICFEGLAASELVKRI